MSPDTFVAQDSWSDLSRIKPLPVIDYQRLYDYRVDRLKAEMRRAGVGMLMLVSPISLRYAAEYRLYGLFQAHIPTTYVFVPLEGALVINAAYGETPNVKDVRAGRPLSFFDGGPNMTSMADDLALDIRNYLSEIGDQTNRVALEYINPSITQALERLDIEVVDGVNLSEMARVIKNEDELACMRWACEVAQLGMAKMKEAMRPGVTELQLWGLLNYTNLANNGDWHDGRMLASGERINPWLQEASPRVLQEGDLVGFDTDMIGPNGYFADISRTFHLGPKPPTKRQKQLYRAAVEEVEHNMALIKPGLTFSAFREQAKVMDPAFREQAYTCLIHGVGMCDEYPQIKHPWKPQPYDGQFEEGMVVCVESYCGAVGERDGVKVEQQVEVTAGGIKLMSDYPWEGRLLDA